MTLASCATCHTQEIKGELIASKRFAGGREFRVGPGLVMSANLTPDPDTGLGQWGEEHFLRKFYQYREYVDASPEVGPESFTLMPWLNLCQLPPEDLSAIYAYLRTVPPVYNAVVKHPEPAAEPSAMPAPTLTRKLGDVLGRKTKRS